MTKLFNVLCGIIATEHINLAPFSVINVWIVAQVLSTSVLVVLKDNGQPETAGVAKHCEMFDNLFDCMSVLNTQECITKQRPFLKSFLSVDDEKLWWIKGTFYLIF